MFERTRQGRHARRPAKIKYKKVKITFRIQTGISDEVLKNSYKYVAFLNLKHTCLKSCGV